MVEVHSEIHYIPLGECWEEVVVRNLLHYVPLHPLSCHCCNGQISTVSILTILTIVCASQLTAREGSNLM
jgi:hypothetical protein